MNKTTHQCAPQPRTAFHLTQRVDYALFLLSILAKQKKNVSASLRTISHTYSMSFAFLQKVAGLLNRKGLIKGTRGKTGGYVLNRSAMSLSLKEIIEAVDGPIQVMGCLSHDTKSLCPRMQFCSVRSTFSTMNEKIMATYYNKKLSDIVKSAL